MEVQDIFCIVTMLVTILLHPVIQKYPKFKKKFKYLANLLIGIIVAIIEWFITKNFSMAITLSGLIAGGTYDICVNLKLLLNQLKKERRNDNEINEVINNDNIELNAIEHDNDKEKDNVTIEKNSNVESDDIEMY